jgi:hypothetical protein
MWLYRGKEIDSLSQMPENIFGFIYEITHTPTGKKYIGKKVLQFHRTLPPLKGQKRKRKITSESDWKTYYGSNKDLKALLKERGPKEFTREILDFVPSKKLLTYFECKYLFIKEVLEQENSTYFNDNILAKFYRKDFLIE